MKSTAILVSLLSGGLLIGQASPEQISPWATGSAAAALGLVCGWLLTKTIPQMQKDFQTTLDGMAERHERSIAAVTERHERWELARHADSVSLNETLRSMSAICAKVHELEQIDTSKE